MTTAAVLILAFLLDCLFADPANRYHPVVGMGKAIAWLDRRIRFFGRKRGWNEKEAAWKWRYAGMILPLVVAGGVWLLTFIGIQGMKQLHPMAGLLFEAVLVWLTMAPRSLAASGKAVYSALVEKKIGEARRRLSMVVGRDTDSLDEGEIVRGGVETIAENIVDAVISPLFYAALGGAPLAMAYRAANTLDSMVGYKNETYLHLGWASARLDDLANWIPARILIPFMLAAFGLLRLSPGAAFQAWRRDARQHPSPNSGIPESLMAGGLQIRLGGVNVYFGKKSFRAYMGKPVQDKKPEHLLKAIRVMWLASGLYLLALSGVCCVIFK